MSEFPDKNPTITRDPDSTFALPSLDLGGPEVTGSLSNEHYELGRLDETKQSSSGGKVDEPPVEQGQAYHIDRSEIRAIPTSYKLLAFSMIIFFNTSSSFSESTLSPLKGIFRAELGVTSKWISASPGKRTLTLRCAVWGHLIRVISGKHHLASIGWHVDRLLGCYIRRNHMLRFHFGRRDRFRLWCQHDSVFFGHRWANINGVRVNAHRVGTAQTLHTLVSRQPSCSRHRSRSCLVPDSQRNLTGNCCANEQDQRVVGVGFVDPGHCNDCQSGGLRGLCDL